MADTESIKKQIDTSGNEALETQEMKDFLKSEENIKKLGEAMESGSSSELLEEMESSLKDLCEEMVIHEDYSENQENIMNYFINKFGNKYPELKEKIELDNTTNTCIKENQIKVENIESINKWCNILGERKVNTKEKVAKIIQNKIDDISKSVNEKIGQNKTGFGFLYGESEIKFIQLWANVNFGENLIINGKRGGKMNDISSFTNEGITNQYIYRQELITRQGLIDYRKAKSNLKNFENLLNIPNLDAKLRLLTPDQQNSVMERFLTSFLAIKQSGMSFENKIGNEKLQTILTDLISAKIYEDLSVEDYFKIFYEEELMDEDTKLLKTDLMSSYKTIGEYFQAKATQNMEIVENEKRKLGILRQNGQI